MKFPIFLQKLLGVNKKNTLLAEIDVTRDIITSKTMGMIKSSEDAFKSLPFKTKQAKDIQALFVKKGIKGNIFTAMARTMDTLLKVLDWIEDTFSDYLSEDITSASLSLQSVTALKLLNVVAFLSDYSRKTCYLIATYEYNHATEQDIHEGITKAFLQDYHDYKYQFLEGIEKFDKPFKDIEKVLTTIPDVMVTPGNYDVIVNTMGVRKVDPLQLNFFSPKYNPIMFVSIHIAQYQANKYEQTKVELQETQAKILKLRQSSNGVNDAKLEQQIRYYTNHNTRLQAQLAEMEEDYELN